MSYKQKQIHHLNLTVPNMEKAIEFYTKALNFKVKDRYTNSEKEFVFISDGNIVYELIENPSLSHAIFDHIAYVSEDIKADYNYFKNLDGSLLQGEIGYADFLFKNGLYYFFIKGSNGEKIEFCQEKR